MLQYGHDLPIPIPDLEVDDYGVRATLSFSRAAHLTVVPWSAVYVVACDDGRGVLYSEDVPAGRHRDRRARDQRRRARPTWRRELESRRDVAMPVAAPEPACARCPPTAGRGRRARHADGRAAAAAARSSASSSSTERSSDGSGSVEVPLLADDGVAEELGQLVVVGARVLVAEARHLGGVEAVEQDVRQQVGLVGAARGRQPPQQLDAGAAARSLEAAGARDVAGDLARGPPTAGSCIRRRSGRARRASW